MEIISFLIFSIPVFIGGIAVGLVTADFIDRERVIYLPREEKSIFKRNRD
jgi:hypothetical protein